MTAIILTLLSAGLLYNAWECRHHGSPDMAAFRGLGAGIFIALSIAVVLAVVSATLWGVVALIHFLWRIT